MAPSVRVPANGISTRLSRRRVAEQPGDEGRGTRAAFAALTMVVMAIERWTAARDRGGEADGVDWGWRGRSAQSCGAPTAAGADAGEPAYPGAMETTGSRCCGRCCRPSSSARIFFFVLRGILRADRTERREYARIEAEERAKRGLPPSPTTPRGDRVRR